MRERGGIETREELMIETVSVVEWQEERGGKDRGKFWVRKGEEEQDDDVLKRREAEGASPLRDPQLGQQFPSRHARLLTSDRHG
eukprot:756215-Hanusia_phi.AAC.2